MSKKKIAVIGGTGMNQWPGLEVEREQKAETPYGAPAAPLVHGRLKGVEVVFLARHGAGHRFPPHLINYRANLWALKEAGAQSVIAIAAVGGIAKNLPPAAVAVPKDLVDYTSDRAHTYSDGEHAPLRHVDFSAPYTPALRKVLLTAARKAKVKVVDGGVMGVTQGPRLESPAEIRRLKRDGCTMVGMTSMPEAALARELALDYAALGVSVNWAAGLGSGDIHGEIEKFIAQGMRKVQAILAGAVLLLAGCASAPPAGPPPHACGLAEFGEAPGITLPAPHRKPVASKSAPAPMAAALEVNRNTADAGRWYDAAPGWKAWRLWLRSDEARSMSVQLQPFDLPPGAEMWICSPDGTLRQGPVAGRGPSGNGELWSGVARGPEIWLELLVPAVEMKEVKLGVPKAFGGAR